MNNSLSAAALPDSPRSPLRQRIDAAWRTPEPECVPHLVEAARLDERLQAKARDMARKLVVGLRATRARSSGVDALMKEFSLSSQEGVALMCLAEALLRVPDKATADRLIRDKLADGDWRSHIGNSPSLFVNAATWGLLITGRLVSTSSAEGLGSALTRLVARGGEPLIRKGMDLAMRMLGEQFVTGRTIDEALERGRAHEQRGYRYSFDMLGEAAMTAADAERYFHDYESAIHAIGKASAGRGVVDGNGISVKLSALHPRYTWAQRERVFAELLPRLKALCVQAKSYDIGLNIDAEEADRLDISLDLLEALAHDPALGDWTGLGFVVQAYQKRAPCVLDFIIELAQRSGRRMMIRLVKGAYWDAEIKRAQLDGLAGYPVYTRKVYTDVSYLACAKKLLAARELIYPQFATHNAHTLAAIFQLGADSTPDGGWQAGDYEFQCLHGMGEPLYDQIVGDPATKRLVRIYAPVGSHETLLAYLVRRLLENGANTSFVNRIVDENVPVEELIADPVEQAALLAGAPHPRIPLPSGILGARRNSAGHDLASEPVRARIAAALAASRATAFAAAPMLAAAVVTGGEALPVTNPADRSEEVGSVMEADTAAVDAACAAAAASARGWAMRPASQRAEMLERAADLFEGDADTLLALAIREAGKSWSNAVAELREAVDFLRYYAAQVRDFDPASHPALGPVLCISPWNFPLAIFSGQVAAALAAGNPVLAKPAEQTPLIAARAVALLHRAGIPADVLQLLPGRGETVGAALVADARVRGVMFTGSTEVAGLINRTLAQRGGNVPLIAETGGQNAMIVDSTALPEQVVADVVASAFDSAGQRCSALRVLCLQQDIADHTLAMLRGALDELRVGNPADVRIDIGPVIDADAQRGLEAHVSAMQAKGARVTRLPLPAGCATGTFVAPTIIEIGSMAELGREQFGPILHVLRFAAGELPALVDTINASGYGLTMGVHTRIDETMEQIRSQAHVGNLYVNRNIIGAVVGVQPFGGEGLSGTGPKAGGPLYLHRLVQRSPGAQLQDGALRVEHDSELPLFDELVQWLDTHGRALLEGDEIIVLRDRADACRARRLAGLRLVLPGPTGEDNNLRFVPRGRVAGVAATAAGCVHQLLAALASDNRIVFDDGAVTRRVQASLPEAIRSRIDLSASWFDADFGALLVDGSDTEADAWQARLAARPGPILPLLRPAPDYDHGRLVHERSVSINTAAAGGNASLMAMGA
ncbi:trifunctional transcriptional regulator/proline dehydrogenase/L-glutamate gamma-semialdehyde dehydrogenase [Thauera sp. 2A1]|uniref:trifunctional transcriptional regulator/proline dehydrogenase/L-glutamate gamma-semialdehyde dehydrogenase n=1 Tax=Thauera sp. 2A1 TaxID=2570191 RepID=UPI001D17A033|nr:trifunctional transcriptional regulator/proline dehydrogenase/L-glutamate gamma-semialdehyde dehydrogenase [Thauera sp. 2A1]KAI5913120.1 trifunctional transcriptional regulator/proline dehydrogenase/L-glutamate gamma-semialdehyde dehydrogenase [Thauera sp. 2A1]